ncbi:MAG: PDGLE domain-containing protein, partial [Schaedlerella arabinosiphila]|nr:PDGLE domain-containing protein [Schaedlerella arabinosiphila]
VLAAAAVLTGGLLSLAASSNPYGLEWSIEKVAGGAELEADGGIYEAAGSIQETTSLLPDYGLKGSESALGTSVSGIAGAAAVVALCAGLCHIFKLFRKCSEQE